MNYVAPDTRPEEMLVDDSASATVRQLGDALTELEVNGHFFGHCSITLILHGSIPVRSSSSQPRRGRRSQSTTAAFSRKHTTCSMHGSVSSLATARTICGAWRCWRRMSPT